MKKTLILGIVIGILISILVYTASAFIPNTGKVKLTSKDCDEQITIMEQFGEVSVSYYRYYSDASWSAKFEVPYSQPIRVNFKTEAKQMCAAVDALYDKVMEISTVLEPRKKR